MRAEVRERAGRLPRGEAVAIDDWVEVAGGVYVVGEEGEERRVALRGVHLGRYPVVNAQFAAFVADARVDVEGELGRRLTEPMLADHPVTGIALADAEAFCAWVSRRLGTAVRLPTGDEWEAAARGRDGRAWPWGDVFDSEHCNSVETGVGFTVPVDAHPGGASECGAEQLAGNVWEWTADRDADGWRLLRGGSWLDSAWGVRAARVLAADPARPTVTTGFRLATGSEEGRKG